MIDGLSNKLCIAVVIRSHIQHLKYIYTYTHILVDRMKVNDDFLDMLMSGKGEEYLDREIERLRVEIG